MEIWDVLDKQGNKTGKKIERGKTMEQGEYFLIVDVWIRNNKGEFLLSKRTLTTDPEPGRWQPTCGCAIAGDNSIAAALREVKEELGIALNPQCGKNFKRFIAWDKAIIDVWVFQQEVDIDEVVLLPEETDDAMWATSDCINDLVKSGRFLSFQRVPYIDELLRMYGH